MSHTDETPPSTENFILQCPTWLRHDADKVNKNVYKCVCRRARAILLDQNENPIRKKNHSQNHPRENRLNIPTGSFAANFRYFRLLKIQLVILMSELTSVGFLNELMVNCRSRMTRIMGG